MKKYILSMSFLIFFSCKSVDNWYEEPVLNPQTAMQAEIYLDQQENYINLVDSRVSTDIKDNLSIEELDDQLKIEKKIAISSQRVLNTWFDFYLLLRQDPGFNEAYKGHYYFRKGIEALGYGDKMRRSRTDNTLKDSIYYKQISLIENQCRLAVGEIVAYNDTFLETDILFKKLKKIYKSMD